MTLASRGATLAAAFAVSVALLAPAAHAAPTDTTDNTATQPGTVTYTDTGDSADGSPAQPGTETNAADVPPVQPGTETDSPSAPEAQPGTTTDTAVESAPNGEGDKPAVQPGTNTEVPEQPDVQPGTTTPEVKPGTTTDPSDNESVAQSDPAPESPAPTVDPVQTDTQPDTPSTGNTPAEQQSVPTPTKNKPAPAADTRKSEVSRVPMTQPQQSKSSTDKKLPSAPKATARPQTFTAAIKVTSPDVKARGGVTVGHRGEFHRGGVEVNGHRVEVDAVGTSASLDTPAMKVKAAIHMKTAHHVPERVAAAWAAFDEEIHKAAAQLAEQAAPASVEVSTNDTTVEASYDTDGASRKS